MQRSRRGPRWSVAHSYLFFFNDPATSDIYTLSLHDALPISSPARPWHWPDVLRHRSRRPALAAASAATRKDRKSTRLNSSHQIISYAVFCLKKKTSPQSLTTGKRQQPLPPPCP